MKTNKKNKGAAMIAVLCIMAIFVTLCLAMLLTASILLSRANKTAYQEQCRVYAVTMSKELEKALCNNTDGDSDFYTMVTDRIKGNMNGTLNNWPYLNTNEFGHSESWGVYLSYKLNAADSKEDVSVRLYWESEYGADVGDIRLHVEVTAALSGEQHTVNTVYSAGKVPADTGSAEKWYWSFSERT